MFAAADVKISSRVMTVFSMLVLTLNGCNDQERREIATYAGGGKVKMITKNSAYSGGSDDWKIFLNCWQRRLSAQPDALVETTLQGSVREGGENDAEILAEIRSVEQRLGIALPKSYRDFMLAFAAVPRPESTAVDDYIGLFAIGQIGLVRDLSPLSLEVAQTYPYESPDSEYFFYGEKQDYINVRTRYMKTSIVVGKYGHSSFEQILLNPLVVTEDGEMETIISYHVGQFRAPSFAEAMRQLSYAEERSPDLMPPYSQNELRGSCAELLPMRDVWWR